MTEMQELKKFLVQLPQKRGFKEDDNFKQSVYKALYFAVTDNGKFLESIFRVENDNLDPWSNSEDADHPFYENVSTVKYTHPSNQVCGRVLEHGEKIYRCDDCGYDDTCVICSFCFRREDHMGHNVSVYLSQANGGMCDCGDDSAFVRDLNCNCSCDTDSVDSLPANFKKSIESTFETILDYILDVTNYSINTLPFIHQNINGQGYLSITSEHISELGSLSQDFYGVEDVNTLDKWILILWNDEDHDYPEAETGIRAATGMDSENANRVATEINANGRAVLKVAHHYTDLLPNQKAAQADGLVATISSARDYLREIIISHIFNWLKDVISFEGNSAFRESAKRILGQVLLKPTFQFSKPISLQFLRSESHDVKTECMKNGIPLGGHFMNTEMPRVSPDTMPSDLRDYYVNFMTHDGNLQFAKSRILHLLAFEVRFVSAVRKRFTRSMLPVLFLDPHTKAMFCEQYVNAYPLLISILAFSDREEELASASDISVQLFTCPRTNQWIFQTNNFPKLLYPLISLIEDHSSTIGPEGFRNLVDVVVDIRSKREKSSIQSTIGVCIDNITRVITKNDEENILNHFLAHENLALFLTLLKYFQGLSSVARKYGDHVERESLKELYFYVSKAVPIASIVQHSTQVSSLNLVSAKESIKKMIKLLGSRKTLHDHSHEVSFKVSKDYVSPFNPMNSFLSFVIQDAGVDAIRSILSDHGLKFWDISDFSLRSIILISQVQVGLWVRNGMAVTRQVLYMTDHSADVTYARDMHLNQITATFDNSEETLNNFLERWELADWFRGNVKHDKTVYEQKFSFIGEKLISFLYKLFVDRSLFDKDVSKAPNDLKIKKAICYALCEDPRSYSQIRKLLPAFITKTDNFDIILEECTEYQAPVGLYDVGIFRLKGSLYESLDPLGNMDIHSPQSIFESLVNNIAKHKSVNAKGVVLVPQFHFCDNEFVNSQIGSIFRTRTFAKLVYKLLQVAIDTEDEEYLPHLLHLLHAVLVDGERLRGKNHVEKNFVSIPICNLLLTIAESSMSVSIVSKADFLLDWFVSCDGNVMDSLVDCFGEAHINSYKHRKENLTESKRQKHSKLAQDRKAKIMKKFAKRREKFLQKNEDFQVSDPHQASQSQDSLLRSCVYCGEAECFASPFGVPISKSSACVFWKLPAQDSRLTESAFSDYSNIYSIGEDEIYSAGFPKEYRKSSTVGSSCAHGFHMQCRERASLSNIIPSPCPLCHNFYDDVVPTFIYDGEFLNGSLISGLPGKIYSFDKDFGFSDEKNREIFQSVIHADYMREGSFTDGFSKVLCSTLKVSRSSTSSPRADRVISVLNEIEILIASTIQANEISLRIDGANSIANLLEEVPSAVKILVRSLVQCRVSLYESQRPIIEKKIKERNLEDQQRPSVFAEIISLFFMTDQPLHALIRYGFAKMVAITSITLCSDFDPYLSTNSFPSEVTASTKNVEAAAVFCEKFGVLPGVKTPSKHISFYSSFYLALERCLLPFLRQCAIFMDILLSKQTSELEFISDSRFEALHADIDQQPYKYTSALLCEVLNLPKLSDLMRLSESDENLAFEFSVFRHFSSKGAQDSLPVGLKTIDFPNVPRLISMPDDFNVTITDSTHLSPSDSVCLICGNRVSSFMRQRHQNQCSPLCLLFSPEENSITTIIELGRNPYEVRIPGPYMTAHGEVKRASSKEKATLNRLRFSHLNKLWINQDLHGFATRTMYGGRMNPIDTTTDMTSDLEEESLEDIEFWE